MEGMGHRRNPAEPGSERTIPQDTVPHTYRPRPKTKGAISSSLKKSILTMDKLLFWPSALTSPRLHTPKGNLIVREV